VYCPSEPTRILAQPEYMVVQRNRKAVFECKVKHDPTLIPTMNWLKDNGELPDDERYSRVDHLLYTHLLSIDMGLL
jgi:receptor-type tyrosine-protein phosphatase zeta